MDTAALLASITSLLPAELRGKPRNTYLQPINALNVTAAGTAGATVPVEVRADPKGWLLGLLGIGTIRNQATAAFIANHPMTVSIVDASQKGFNPNNTPNDFNNVFGPDAGRPAFLPLLIPPGQTFTFTFVNLSATAVDVRCTLASYIIPA